ncbi:tail fiber assembly protein [Escherichia coli]|nr:tail fiber assembly protein [Escherichia coli]
MGYYYFSASTLGFYAAELKDDYETAGTFPDDAVQLDDQMSADFIRPAPEGKYLSAGSDVYPEWAVIPPPTYDEMIADAEAQKQRLIDQANAYMNSKQWPGKAAMGRLTESEKAKYNAWLDYLDALEAVDTSSAPDINWPTPPAVA